MNPQQSVMFATASLGGGHLSTARTIAEALTRFHGDSCTSDIVDVFTESRSALDGLFKTTYNYMCNRAPLLYQVFYALTDHPAIVSFLQSFSSGKVLRCMEELVANRRPRVIVCNYPLFTRLAVEACARVGHNARVIEVVSDAFIAHSYWFSTARMDCIIVPSEVLYRRALALGIPAHKVLRTGYPINLKFDRRMSAEERDAFKVSLGIPAAAKTVLIAGGGEGLKIGSALVRAMLAERLDAYLLVVCARNAALKQELDALAATHPPLKPFGFVSTMYELINVADVVVAKGGPATVFEVLSQRKPLIIPEFIRPHEKGNVDFVVQSGVGSYDHDPVSVTRTVREYLENPAAGTAVEKAYNALDLTNGTRTIADVIAAWAGGRCP